MSIKSLCLLGAASFAFTGCMDAERKLGRGINNVTEFARFGEVSRSVEQTTLSEGAAVGRSYGVIHGINRSIGRTAVGAFEILTFPFPSEPYIRPEHPVYPDSYTPGYFNTSTLESDNNLGFSGGESAPILPGSRFRIF